MGLGCSNCQDSGSFQHMNLWLIKHKSVCGPVMFQTSTRFNINKNVTRLNWLGLLQTIRDLVLTIERSTTKLRSIVDVFL